MKKSVRSALINSVILAVILALVAVYYFTVVKKKDAGSNGLLLDDIRKNDIRSLDVEWNGPTNRFRAALVNRDGNWKLVSPVSENADAETVNTTLNALTSLEIVRTFTNSADRREYGVGKPELTVRIRYTDGPGLDVSDGGSSSDGKYRYFSRSDRSNFVFLVKNEQQKDLLSTVDDYRDKNIFTLPMDELTAVEIVSGGRTYRFGTTGGIKGFRLLAPVKKTVDSASFRSRLIDFYSLSVSRFLDSGKPAYGLEKPNYIVRIFSGKAAEELLVGKNSGADSYYILLTKKGVVAETSDANLPAKFDMGPFLSGAGDGK